MRLFLKKICFLSQTRSPVTTEIICRFISSNSDKPDTTDIKSTKGNELDDQVKSTESETSIEKRTTELESTAVEIMNPERVFNKLGIENSKNISRLKPAIKVKSCNLATYVNQSEILKNLVKLGVNLNTVESNVEASNYLLKGDFNRDIEPYLQYLHSVGVPDTSIAKYITKNPSIFLQSIENLKSRIGYLTAKKFDEKSIVDIITKCPTFLNLPSKMVDAKLGFFQKQFSLTGDEVRNLITRLPKLIIWSKASINETTFVMKDICGFEKNEQKQILLSLPKVYMLGRHALETRFSFIHNTLGFTHDQITSDPRPLRTRVQVLRSRHKFLKTLKRDQYNPELPNYVSLTKLASGRDSEFVQLVAKTTISKYDEFLKTL